PTSLIVPALAGPRMACLPIIHDLIAFRGEPHDRKAMLTERLLMARALRKARHICAISDSTKQDLLNRFAFLSPTNVTAIYAGPHRQNPPHHVSDGKTILCVAT